VKTICYYEEENNGREKRGQAKWGQTGNQTREAQHNGARSYRSITSKMSEKDEPVRGVGAVTPLVVDRDEKKGPNREGGKQKDLGKGVKFDLQIRTDRVTFRRQERNTKMKDGEKVGRGATCKERMLKSGR